MANKKVARTKKIIFLVTPQEKKDLETEAVRRGVSLAQVIRERVFKQ